MKSIVAERVDHKGSSRIALRFAYDAELISLLKEIPEVQWSRTMNCWHLPDNKAMVGRISVIFNEKATIDLSGILPLDRDLKKTDMTIESQAEIPVQASLNGSFHKTLVSPTDKLSNSGQRPIRVESGENESKSGWNSYSPVEFTINESDGKLIIRFTGKYDKDWIKELRSYGRLWFDDARFEWQMSWSRMKVDSLSDYFASQGIEVLVKKAVIPIRIKEQRDGFGTEIRERELSVETAQKIENLNRYLIEKRYSKNTIETYISLLELFFKYFSDKSAADITEEDISDFFHDFIIYHSYSASYHNQLISAIKMFYRLNGSDVIEPESLGRPRRGRALPKVFSKEEIKSILNASRNIKHKLILWIIYSCGLRRSEVINIKLSDLDRSRGILTIREPKGMNDRIVPVSERVWEKIEEYIGSYHPEFWLFEGQTGGKYSAESVHQVFKNALKSAGIKKDVGVHSLRHSYATHLHENGVDIRYIQELLGHKSSRTTEIYTHVSRRNLVAIKSPIEDLDLK